MAKHTSLRARFLGFAGGHFVLSALGSTVAFAMFGAADAGVGLLGALTALLMLLYVPAGAFAAFLLNWERPTVREWFRAVALVGGIACLWGFGGFALCLTEPTSLFGFCLLMSTAFLASPSFCLMFLVLIQVLEVNSLGWALLWFPSIAAAALLPPVLFFLGALWGRQTVPLAREEMNSHVDGDAV